MNLNQPTLVQFEKERSLNNFIPPEKSNSFYNIGDGILNLFCVRANPDNCRFEISTESGSMRTGTDVFHISGDIIDPTKPYKSLLIKENTTVCVDDKLVVNSGTMDVHGTLVLEKGSQLIVNNGGSLILYSDSTFCVDDNTSIIVEKGATLSIYGDINVNLSVVDLIINNSSIYVDSAAHVNVREINLGDRDYSLTDYEMSLRSKSINPHTQGEYNSSTGRIGYTWKDGDPNNGSQLIELGVLWGTAVLGDFKLSVLGKQINEIKNLQVLESFRVAAGTTLYISEEYNESPYIRPELYLGVVIGNCKEEGYAIIDGTVIVDGYRSMITIDRGAMLSIGKTGFVYLNNNATIRSTHNNPDDIVLVINGTLVVDDISQLVGFESGNIAFGETGKLIILNPDTGERRLLWSTPNGIESTDLYRLFKDKLKHVEYHISNNTGIAIDEFFDFYARDMTNWYAGIRIEKAIHEGMLVWHDGGFIELNHSVIPWADVTCSLLHAARLFKSFGSFDEDKLQEVTARLKYAGAGNIVFRFVNGNESSEVVMILDGIEMKSVVNKPLTDAYVLTTNTNGELFVQNMVASPDANIIISEDSRVVHLNNRETEFEL